MKRKIRTITSLSSIWMLIPMVAFAAPKTFSELIDIMIDFLDQATIVLFGLAVLFFFWNTMKGMFSSNNPEGRKKQGEAIMWGIIILFVMTSFWGILKMLQMLLMRGF